MPIKVITPPAALLTLADLRLHLKLDTSGGTHPDDALVSAALMGAHRFAEHYTQVSLGSQTLELALDAFPSSSSDAAGSTIQLPRGPVTGITSVKYIDTAGTLQTISASDYALDDYSMPPRLYPAYSKTWPATRPIFNSVLVRYVAGATLLDEAVRNALLLIVAHLYENRTNVVQGAVPTEVPMGAKTFLDTVRVWSM